MTVRTWLHERTPIAPPRLAERLEEVLGARCDAAHSEAPRVCIAAATELLTDLLARPSAGRESALDLLTVDALVTYAFEAAAAEPSALPSYAAEAMSTLAATAS